MSERKPNILWICTDQQRWDTIEALGNQYINTPNLNKLVESGVAFTRAYSQSTICTPSRASFMTGRYPAAHQVHRNGAEFFPEGEVLVSKILADSGYHCGLIGKQHLSRAQGIIEKRPEDGYEEFYYSHHPYPDGPEPGDYARWLQEEKGMDINKLYPDKQKAYGPGVPEEFHQTAWAGARALEFIEKNKDKSWMLNINLFDPHPPFDPPEEFLHHYQEENIPLPVFQESDISRQKQFEKLDQQVKTAQNILEMDQKNMELSQNSDGPTHSSAPSSYNPRKVKACYYASIELIDKYTGIIMDKLEELGLLQNTIIIFMSDHGELLGDHGLLYKGCRFFEGLVHVPLIISGRGRFEENLKSEALVELIDIAPTLLDAADLETPYWMQGKSLYPLLTGKKNLDQHKLQVISEFNDALNLPEASHGFMCFDGKYKIAIYQDLEIGEIYDLENDPEEFNNLWTDSEYEELKQKLLQKLVKTVMKSGSTGIRRTGDY